jgi:hybrid cluster-associated redox disulfide protein
MFPEFRRRIFAMAETYVTGETLVGEIVTQYPEAIEVLLSIGMHCLGCPASRAESLADACAVHGMPVDRVIEAINAKIAEAR